jgi:hypothetical protein
MAVACTPQAVFAQRRPKGPSFSIITRRVQSVGLLERTP